MQDLVAAGGFRLASGSSPKVGGFTVTAQAALADLSGASVSVLSVPFDRFHKMHDLAMQAVEVRRQRLLREQQSARDYLFVMETVQRPDANMVLLQVRSATTSAQNACTCRESSLGPPSASTGRGAAAACQLLLCGLRDARRTACAGEGKSAFCAGRLLRAEAFGQRSRARADAWSHIIQRAGRTSQCLSRQVSRILAVYTIVCIVRICKQNALSTSSCLVQSSVLGWPSAHGSSRPADGCICRVYWVTCADQSVQGYTLCGLQVGAHHIRPDSGRRYCQHAADSAVRDGW